MAEGPSSIQQENRFNKSNFTESLVNLGPGDVILINEKDESKLTINITLYCNVL